MSKSNHQKHGFHPKKKGWKRDKNFVFINSFMAKNLKHARWNGTPLDVFPGEVGRLESIRFIETGG